MKFKYILVSVIATFAVFSSCLDKLAEGELPTGGIDYTDDSKMFEPVTGIYAAARTENGFGRWSLYALIAVRSDDVLKGGTETDQAQLQYAKEFKYNQMKDYWALNDSWKGLYDLVENCNEALNILDKYYEAAQTDDVKALNLQYQGEVRFIRAYAYFWIVRLWGDIPLFTDNQDLVSGVLTKTNKKDVYQFLNDELDFCISNLPLKRPNQMPYKGQVTRLSAWGLKAKVNADINNWEAVYAASNDLIESGLIANLYTDYYQYFKIPGKLADETLYELQYIVNSNISLLPDNWFAFQGPGKITGLTTMNGGWNFLPASPEIQAIFNNRGETVREDATFIFNNSITLSGDTISGNSYNAYNGKVYLPSDQLNPANIDYGAGNNIRMLRYADVLLLNAEARIRLGKGNAENPFNIVRRRANMPELPSVTLDQVLEERQVEFALEWGDRFFDLVRTDRAATVLPGFVKGQSEYYPIPQAQIDLNPALGY